MATRAIHRPVTPEERLALRELTGSPASVAGRARIVLAVVDGASPAALARRHGLPRTTVYSWVRRFSAFGIAGFRAAARASSVGAESAPGDAGGAVMPPARSLAHGQLPCVLPEDRSRAARGPSGEQRQQVLRVELRPVAVVGPEQRQDRGDKVDQDAGIVADLLAGIPAG